jgi:hypothetical protein
MKNLLFFVLFLMSSTALGAESAITVTPQTEISPAGTEIAPPKPKTRALRLAPVFNTLVALPFESTARLGVGLKMNYEFILTPHTTLGIHLAPRYFPDRTAQLVQLGYGLILRHTFLRPEAKLRPYLEYGLLLQLSWFPGYLTGTGTSHDTRLCVGFDSKWSKKVPMFFEIAYDYSRLSYFGQSSQPVDRIEIDLGFEYQW